MQETEPKLNPETSAYDKVFAALQGVSLPKDILRQIGVRRAGNPIRNLHHHAFRCRNAEETRHFYEDILGLPLTQTVIKNRNFTPGKSNFCHLFFELGDGSALAFFDCTGGLISRGYEPDTGWDHHIALEVEGDQVIDAFKRRLESAGVPTIYTNHEVYHSLYFNDPNGLNLELVTKSPSTDEYERKAPQVAHQQLELWMNKVHKA